MWSQFVTTSVFPRAVRWKAKVTTLLGTGRKLRPVQFPDFQSLAPVIEWMPAPVG